MKICNEMSENEIEFNRHMKLCNEMSENEIEFNRHMKCQRMK